jgi:hypothetical protein
MATPIKDTTVEIAEVETAKMQKQCLNSSQEATHANMKMQKLIEK